MGQEGAVRQVSCVPRTVGVHPAGLPRMCTLPLLAGQNIGHAFVVPTVAARVDLVVHVGSKPDGRPSPRSTEGGHEETGEGQEDLVVGCHHELRFDAF